MILTKKKALQQAFKMILFLILLFSILLYCNRTLQTNAIKYDSTGSSLADGCDVIFAGTSQSFYAVNPSLLWDEYGIASYNFSAMAQYIGITYYSLMDIFKYQTPKVLILDYESMERPGDFQVSSNMLYSLPTIDDLSLRYKMYDSVMQEDTAYFLPLLRYHTRWKELSKADFVVTNNHYNLGSGVLTYSGNPNGELPNVYNVDAGEIGEEELYYLDLIYELTKTNHCALVLVDYPSYSDESVAPLTAAVKEWANKHSVSYLNFNSSTIYSQMDLVCSDFADVLHLNIYGANKASHYLGNWLLTTFSLPDRRIDPLYAYWEDKVADAHKLINSKLLPTITDYKKYCDALELGDYTIVMASSGTYGGDDYGVLVRKNHEKLYSASGPEAFSHFMQIYSDDLSIIGEPYVDESGALCSMTSIFYNQAYSNHVTNGINMLVYDNFLETVIDTVGFDSDQGFIAVR